MPRLARLTLFVAATATYVVAAAQEPATLTTVTLPGNPLPSWNEGPAKSAILDFVHRTTTAGSPDFLPPSERIAVFDNDGTLWPENPLPFEVAFSLDAARRMMAAKPELQTHPAYQALQAGNIAALAEDHFKLLLQLVADTHAGMTTEEFDRSVAEWIATARHPRFNRLYSQCTYLPMQEVLRYFRDRGFKTFIVSGGGQDFIRVWSERVYGIPPEQVIGSTFKLKYELKDDRPTITILPDVDLIDDKAGKPVGIRRAVGRTPVVCFGNSDGDHEMLQLTTIGRRPSFGLIVHHTDADREYAYDAHPKSSGKLIEALAAAPARGWIVVDMKRDWNTIFSAQP